MAPINKKTTKGKRLPPTPAGMRTTPIKQTIKNPLFEKTPKNFMIGGSFQPKRNLSRFVKWPKYIRFQRQKRVLLQRLKVPPALNQFNHALDKNMDRRLFDFLSHYRPETKLEKKNRLAVEAERQVAGNTPTTKKPTLLKYGLNHVTDLVEIKKAKLVVIAHDVDPIELVVWLPALCRRRDIPYCIVKSKSRLGKLVHQKTASVVAIDNVRKEDISDFQTICKNMKAQFNDSVDSRRRWGGGMLGIKSQHRQIKKDKAITTEITNKVGKV